MLYTFEHGAYSSHNTSPVVEGPDGADLRALVREWAREVWDAKPEWLDYFSLEGCPLFTNEAGIEALGGSDGPRGVGSWWELVDHFAAWLVIRKGWRCPPQRSFAIDGLVDGFEAEVV